MNENTSGGSKKRKMLSVTLAVAMVATMLLSGTLAYFYQSNAINTVTGQQLKKLAIAHDDFDPETGNKDVYVENAGESTLYVRVRLTESYQDNSAGGERAYKDGYGVTADGKHGEMNHSTKNINFAGEWASGGGTDADFHANYFAWTTGSDSKTFLRGTITTGEKFYSTDASSERYLLEGVAHDSMNDGTLYTWTEEKNDIYGKTASCDGIIGARTWVNAAGYDGDSSDPLSSAMWKKNYSGWLVGADGWMYWSQPLKKGEATGLLLDHVEKLGKVADDQFDYEYKIYVDFEAVDDTDVEKLWFKGEGPSSSGSEWTDENTVVTATEQAVVKNLINYNNCDFELLEEKFNDALNTCKGVLGEESTEYKMIVTKLENIKYSMYVGSLKQNDVLKQIEDAVSIASSYQRQKELYEEDPSLYKNPDEVVLMQTKTDSTAESVIEMGVDDLSTYLVNTVGNATDGTITRFQAQQLTEIGLRGESYNVSAAGTPANMAKQKVVNKLNYVNKDNFPNLKKISFVYCRITPVGTSEAEAKTKSSDVCLSNLPNSLKRVEFTGVYDPYGLISVDVRGLSLEDVKIYYNSGKCLRNSVEKEPACGAICGLLSVDKKSWKSFDIRYIDKMKDVNGNDFTTLNMNEFPSIESLYVGNSVTSINCPTENSILKALYLDRCTLIKRLDISKFVALPELNVGGAINLEKVVCADKQRVIHSANSAFEALKVFVVDDPDHVYFYTIAKGSSTRVADPNAATNWPTEYAELFPNP